MKILCGLSSIEYEVSHFPYSLTSRESHHPIFDIPQKKLLPLIQRYDDEEFTPTDSYLYYLALFNSTSLVHFRLPAIRTTLTSSIVAQNIHRLHEMVEMINVMGADKIKGILHLPQFVIDVETRDLSSTHDWIKIWDAACEEYENGYVKASNDEKRKRREEILERFIKDPNKDISSYAGHLAEWASIAGRLELEHNYNVADENDKPIPLAEYWKRIIKRCAKGDGLYEIPMGDLLDLQDYYETEVEQHGIYSHCLLTLLRVSIDRKKNYLDLNDVDLSPDGTTFRILDPDADVADANMLAIIDSAPKKEPIRTDYPSNLAFLRAKMNYQMAKEYNEELEKHNALMREAEAVAAINAEEYTPPIATDVTDSIATPTETPTQSSNNVEGY